MIVNWNAKATKPFIQPESWQNLPKGDNYCQALRQTLMPWMPKILGHQVLKIGGLSGEVTTNLPMHHQIILSEKITQNLTALCNAKVSLVQASLTELPCLQKEINAVFLMNTLNFAQDPHQILRESHRILTDDGWIFIALFNPLSPLIFKRKIGGSNTIHIVLFFGKCTNKNLFLIKKYNKKRGTLLYLFSNRITKTIITMKIYS